MKRAISLLVSLALALSLLPAAARASSPAYGSDVWLRDVSLQEGVTYSENIFWSGDYDKPRHEYYFTYTPGLGGNLTPAAEEQPAVSEWNPGGLDLSWLFPGRAEGEEDVPGYDGGANGEDDPLAPPADGAVPAGVRPVASYGGSVCGRSTVSEAAQAYEQLGYRVVGAINGDFYDMATGYPLGILISDGEVLSGSSEYYAVGFRADGSAVMGSPQLSMVASAGERSLKLASLNKPRVDDAGVTMLTYDYRDDHTAGPSVASDGVNVLASIVDGRAAIGGTLTLLVEEVAEDAQDRTLAENQVLLTGGVNGYTEGLGFLRSLTAGDLVTVSFTTPDPRWNEVVEAIGAYHLLVENGEAQGGFEVSAAPRTAVGVKDNGDVILYTLDGRQNDVSMGASLGVLASRMAELGCVTALCLDGGGSTTAVAATPDSACAGLLNSPSDKTQRQVTNHLLLLAPGDATGEPGGVYLAAAAPAVLTGQTVELTANVTDTHYFPMDLPLTFYTTGGEAADGAFTAPQQSGRFTVTAVYDGLYAQQDILVVDAPETMSIQGGDGASSLIVMAGGTAQLTLSSVYNHMPLEISPEDVVWTVDPGLGTIDETGLFTASGQSGAGSITAARGDVLAVIPVSVEANHPFEDLENHWAEAYMGQLYQQKILTGEMGEDGLLYAYPERGLSRAEFSVLLARYLGLNTADYAEEETPFEDLEGVESWAGGAIRAMYGLGIVNGVEPTRFDPQAPLERAQAAAMLGRALGLTEPSGEDSGAPSESEEEPGGDAGGVPEGQEDDEPPLPDEPKLPEEGTALSARISDLSDYPDADAIPAYALDYFRILVAAGAVDARDGLLLPASPMTRAEICKALVIMQA